MLPTRAVPPVRAFRVVRGVNALGELEAIVGIGRGRFEDGLHVLVRTLGGRASLLPLRGARGPLFPHADEQVYWAVGVYEEDARAMGMMTGGVSDKVSFLLASGWPHLAEAARRRAVARVDGALTGFGAAWAASGRTRWWSPPPPPQGQADVRAWLDED